MIKMNKYIFLLTFPLVLNSCQQNQKGINLTFTGDVILDRGVNDQIRLYGDSILINSIKRINAQDFLIINYEGTFTNNGIKQNDKYNFKANESYAKYLNQAGVTHASITNNHIYDFGSIGYENTLKTLKNNSITPLGETNKPQIIEKGKYKCAVLSASLSSNNDSLSISSINELKGSVLAFVKNYADIPLILYIHWGLELQHTPELWQRELATELIDLGVDAIIGHHPHVIQTIEYIKDVPVFYSLGNFVADAYLPETDNSIIVDLCITNKITEVKIRPVKIKRYFPHSVKPEKQFSFLRQSLSYSKDIFIVKLNNYWKLAQNKRANFKVNSNTWVFYSDKIITKINSLESGSFIATIYTHNDTSNTVGLHGILSEFQIGDIDNDGKEDLLFGLSKKVNFDQVFKKRINVYSYQDGNLQPLWLGTKFIYDIESFDIYRENNFNYLSTIEVDSLGNKFQGIYEWDDFGFALKTFNPIK